MRIDVFSLVPHAFAWLTEQRPLAAVLGTGLDLRLFNYRDCALLKRWISSRKRIVRLPLVPRRSRARWSTSRTSFTVAETAESSSNAAPVLAATMRASVVLPLPGGP